MNEELVITLMRATWLTLCGMMLFSRFAFQYAGPVRMRAFLDLWKVSKTHRVWGVSAFVYGLLLLAAGAGVLPGLNRWDIGLGLLLIGVLLADGLLNFMPAAFSQFKEKMQDEWVRRRQEKDTGDDRALFGTVNFFLGLASVGMAGVVIFYRPLQPGLIAISLGAAIVLTGLLIIACVHEGREAA